MSGSFWLRHLNPSSAVLLRSTAGTLTPVLTILCRGSLSQVDPLFLYRMAAAAVYKANASTCPVRVQCSVSAFSVWPVVVSVHRSSVFPIHPVNLHPQLDHRILLSVLCEPLSGLFRLIYLCLLKSIGIRPEPTTPAANTEQDAFHLRLSSC